MAKERTEPRISVNKLAQYVTSKAARQNQILRTAKFPPTYITAYYRDAAEAIARFLASNLTDYALLDGAIASLDQKPADNVHEARRIAGNIDAIEKFSVLLDDIEFNGASPKLGSQTAAHVKIANVSVSVRPEVTLHSTSKKGGFVGGIKLHFPVTEPLNEEQAGYICAMLHRYCEDHMFNDGSPLPGHCMVIDLASQRVFPGVKAIKNRLKDVESACSQINSLWPSIKE